MENGLVSHYVEKWKAWLVTTRTRIGWLSFTLSGVIFFVIGAQERDPLTMAASVIWTFGCIMFVTDHLAADSSPGRLSSGQLPPDDRYLPDDGNPHRS